MNTNEEIAQGLQPDVPREPCGACGEETYVTEITRCRGCDNEFYTRDQSLTASRRRHPVAEPKEGDAQPEGVDVGGLKMCPTCNAMPIDKNGKFWPHPHAHEGDAQPVALERWRKALMSDELYNRVAWLESRAAQPGTLAVALADGFRNMGNDDGNDVSHPANWNLGGWVLYATQVKNLLDAHPVDVPPDGPWETRKDEHFWWVRGKRGEHMCQIDCLTEAQAIAVRDALNGVNRLEGEKP